MQFENIIKEMQRMRDAIDMGAEMDQYEMVKWLDLTMIDLEEDKKWQDQELADVRDEARDAYGWQETYEEQLHHAEAHIKWLEEEFNDEIVEADKYERAC